MAAPLTFGISSGNPGALRIEGEGLTGAVAEPYRCLLSRLREVQEVTLYSAPQARLLQMLQSNEIDLAAPLAKTDDRNEYALFSGPFFTADFSVYSQAGLPDVRNLNELEFGTLRTSSMNPVIRSRGGTIFEVDSYRQALQMVEAGRLDAVVIPDLSIGPNLELAKSLNQQVFVSQEIGVYVRPARAFVHEALNSHLQECSTP